MAKFIFVTGGVVSSLGKGIAAASIGCLLESRGLTVTCQDGSPGCDQDTVAGQCTFLAFYCFNQAALEVLNPSCFASDVARIDIASGMADAGPVLDAFEDTLTRVGGASMVVRDATSLVPSEPVTRDVCGAMRVVVLAGDTTVLRVGVSDDSDPVRTDIDQLSFVCTP